MKYSSGRHVFAGRFLCAALLLAALGGLAASRVADELSAFTAEAGAGLDARDREAQYRLALLRRAARSDTSVLTLDQAEVTALFGLPELRRAEPEAEAWQYTVPGCALDLYFVESGQRMAYAEYRQLGAAAEPSARRHPDYRSCLSALFTRITANQRL